MLADCEGLGTFWDVLGAAAAPVEVKSPAGELLCKNGDWQQVAREEIVLDVSECQAGELYDSPGDGAIEPVAADERGRRSRCT